MIYLASPYWHPDPAIRNERFRAACRVTAEMIRQGTTVFSPVVYGHALVGEGLPGDWSFWQRHGSEHLALCEEVVVLRLDGWEESEGVTAELGLAAALGKSVRYVESHEAITSEAIATTPARSMDSAHAFRNRRTRR